MKKISLLLALCFAMFTGCASADKSISYKVLSTEKQFAKPVAGAMIINSEMDYTSMLMGRAIKSAGPVSGFDFDANSLLLVFAGRGTCDGCGLEIISITEQDNIIVKVRPGTAENNKPTDYFISVPKTDKDAKLVFE